MGKIISAFAPPTPEYAALRLSKWGTPEARKFYWTMEPKTVHVIAAAEHALYGEGRHVDGAWSIAIRNGIVFG